MPNLEFKRADPVAMNPDPLDAMPEREFVKAWKAIVGEPPAIMLDRRGDMVRLLVESVPIATLDLAYPSIKDQPTIEKP